MTQEFIKTPQEIDIMRRNGKIFAHIMETLSKMIKPGLDVWELEKTFITMCKENKANPSCKGYTAHGFLPPFPTGLCISINNQSVHCFPKKGTILDEGDIITVDTVIDKDDYFVDGAFVIGVGNISESNEKLVKTSKEALMETIKIIKPGVRMGDLGHTMYSTVKRNGFDVLRDYAGHGIGTQMHQEPEVPCVGKPNTGIYLEEGMTICVEALVTEGLPKVKNIDEWETQMADKKNFAQSEYTVLVTATGYEILTPFVV